MSQALSNLAIGSKVKFGSYSVNGEAAQPIVWTVVAKNHQCTPAYPTNAITLHAAEILDLRCFDAKEPSNGNSDRQNYGNNRYSVSNLDQWLNKDAAGGAWYSAAHSTDQSPNSSSVVYANTQYASRPGFLNGFTDDEKAAILSTTIRVVKPSVDGGSYEDVVRKVFLPSTTEVGLSNENSIAEGAAWGYYTSNTARIGYLTQQCFSNTPSSPKPSSKTTAWYWWLRTPYFSYDYRARYVYSDGSLYGDGAYRGYYGVRPALNLSNTLKVSDTTDGDGCYTFEWSGSTAPDPTPGGGETGATQALGNLPIGAKVKYGKHSVNGETPEPIIWIIVDKNHTGYPSNSVTLNTTQIIDVRSFDSHEPNNPNTNRATYGNNNYQVSNLDQWLNKSDADGKWYQAAHAYDYPPSTVTSSGESSYVERPGFLHFFTSQERASLLNTTLKVLMPRIDTNAGTIKTISRKVFLLSLPEVGLGKENGVSDGTAIAYFTSATRAKTVTDQVFDNTKAIGAHLPSSRNAPHYWWLRTPYYADTFTVTGVFNTTTGTRGDYTAQTANIGVAPAINLSSSLKVTTTVDEDGCYTFVWPLKPGAWVGGTEKYTSNEIRNVFIALDSLRKVSWRDDLDEFISATSGNMIQGWINNNDDAAKCSWWCATGKATSAPGAVGGRETISFTFARALTGVSFAFMNYRYDNSVEAENERGSLEIYLNNETTPKTSVNYTKADTYINYDLGNVSAGDTIKIKVWTVVSDDSIPNFTIRVLPSCDPIALTPEIVSVPGTRTNDRRVSSIYAGVTATVPVYTETTTTEDIALSSTTFTDFFSADNTGTKGTNAKGITWADNSGGGLKLTFGNYGIDSSTSMTTFTAQRNLTNVVIKGLYYTETRYDKITLTVAGTTVLDAVSGTSSTLTQRWTGSLSKGQTIVLKFVKDSSQSATNESSTYFTLSCDPYQKTTVNKTQTGTETKLVDKKIVKGYVGGPDGKARLFFGENAPSISYTGEYEVFNYSLDGKPYDIYRLNTSGSLTCSQPIEYWACGGGASGWGGNYSYPHAGLGGASGFIKAGPLEEGTYTITIGAGGTGEAQAGSNTIIAGDNTISIMGAKSGSFSGNTFNTDETLGNSSGGGSYGVIAGYGFTSASAYKATCSDWKNVFPFGIYDLKAHCAGGGGGGVAIDEDSSIDAGRYCYAGAGGSFGEPGKNYTSYSGGTYTSARSAKGGYYGGGDGGATTTSAGKNATFYGSGGGGASFYSKVTSSSITDSSLAIGGSGYQGACYLLVPSKKVSAEKEMVKVILEGNDYLTEGYRTYLTINENPNDNSTLIDSNKLGSISGSYYVPKNTQVDIWIFTAASSITPNLVSFNGSQSSAAARKNSYEIFSFTANKSYKISLTGPTTSSSKVTKVTITTI